MKLLLDACVWKGAGPFLAEAGHDVIWVGDWASDPGDEEILRAAQAQSRILVTLDKDFGELAVVRGVRHSGIIRLVGFRAEGQGPALRATLAKYGPALAEGSLLTVEPTRVRIKPPQPPGEDGGSDPENALHDQ